MQTVVRFDRHVFNGSDILVTANSFKLRFAPSPNGLLHLGHAYSALKTYEMARQLGGAVLVRIEDIDVRRSRPAFVTAIEEDLAWLGFSWPEPTLKQSQRFLAYGDAAQRLRGLGVLYPCAATRSDIQAAASDTTDKDPDGVPLFPGRGQVISDQENSARISAGMPHAYRLDMARALEVASERLGGQALAFSEMDEAGAMTRYDVQPERWGDIVIVRKDVPTSYHLAVVVDDAHQRISHVTRGRDLFFATDIQRLLQVLLDLSEPIYSHHALIVDETGKKLSKSDNATSLQFLRESGKSSDETKEMLERMPKK